MFDLVKTQILGLYLDDPCRHSPYPLWELYQLYDSNEVNLNETDGLINQIYINNNQSIIYYWLRNGMIDLEEFSELGFQQLILNKEYLNRSLLNNYSIEERMYRLLFKVNGYSFPQTACGYQFKVINFSKGRIDKIVELIQQMGFQLTKNQILEWISLKVFHQDTWILMIDLNNELPVGLLIADYDSKIREGFIKYHQVLPRYRKQGMETLMVNELIKRLKEKVDFVTLTTNDSNLIDIYKNIGFSNLHTWYKLKFKNV